jgi:single-stranded-DNA-specific exonuclease
MLWVEDQHEEGPVEEISQTLSVSTILSKFLVSLGINDVESAKKFLKPKLAYLSDPFDIPSMSLAVDRIVKAIDNKEKILLIGDYDVDGITSTVIVKKNLIALGLNPIHITPKRKTEGYGLTKEVLNRGLEMGPISLVIALDCGTNSKEEGESLHAKGIDLIIVDHHQAKEKFESQSIQINPHLHEDKGEPWRFLCTAGLAFKLVHAILKHLRQKGVKKAFEINPKDSLSLAGLGTIADLVPLRDENRILASFGLKYLKEKPSVGLHALLAQANILSNSILDSEDVAFKIAPRINACGRLDDAEVATSLLLETDQEKSKLLAKSMNDYNEERKGIESKLTENALQQAKKSFSNRSAAVVCGQGEYWNPGVVGIVAGKLSGSLGKPCIVLAQTDNECKGSGRSVEGVNLVHSLAQCAKFLSHWGGHPAAVGLTLPRHNLEEFKEEFIKVVEKDTGGSFPEQSLRIATTVKQEDVQESLLDDLRNLAPFGQDNPEPILAIKKIRLANEPKKVGTGSHFRFSIHNGISTIAGIAWNMSDRIPPTSTDLDLAFRLRWNYWNGRKNPQIILENWRVSH